MAKRYLDGNPPVSLSDYQKQKAEEEQIKYYLNGSRTRTEPTFVPKYLDDTDKAYYKKSIKKYEKEIKELQKELISFDKQYKTKINGNEVYYIGDKGPTKEEQDDLKFINYRIESYKEQIDEITKSLKQGYFSKSDFNCIATATSNNPNKGHTVTGNQTFYSNPSKYGWKRIPINDVTPGSLIQMKDDYGIPDHAVILDTIENGTKYFNYSNGTDTYQKHVPSWVPDNYLIGYKFVGNSADSLRWEQEYNNLYKKKNGGLYKKRLVDNPPVSSNKFDKQTIEETKQEENYNPTKPYHPIYNHPASGGLEPLGDKYVSYVPIIGTGLDVINFANNPTKENAIQAGTSIVLDALASQTGKVVKYLTKPTGKVTEIKPWHSTRRRKGIIKNNKRALEGINPIPYTFGSEIMQAPFEYISNNPQYWPNK